jgi:hypothetical protein
MLITGLEDQAISLTVSRTPIAVNSTPDFFHVLSFFLFSAGTQAWAAHSNEVHGFLARRASAALKTAVKAAVEKFGQGSVKGGSPMRFVNGKLAFGAHAAKSAAQSFVVQVRSFLGSLIFFFLECSMFGFLNLPVRFVF